MCAHILPAIITMQPFITVVRRKSYYLLSCFYLFQSFNFNLKVLTLNAYTLYRIPSLFVTIGHQFVQLKAEPQILSKPAYIWCVREWTPELEIVLYHRSSFCCSAWKSEFPTGKSAPEVGSRTRPKY